MLKRQKQLAKKQARIAPVVKNKIVPDENKDRGSNQDDQKRVCKDS